MPERSPTVRERILDATVEAVDRTGLSGFTVEAAAREAGVGRATVYRHFSGGRDQLLREATAWEVGRFFTRLAAHVEDAPDLRTRLDLGLAFAAQALADHELFQRLRHREEEALLSRLEDVSARSIMVVRGYLASYLVDEDLAPGVGLDWAADHLARLILSHIGAPGQWDLADDEQRATLVDTVLLPGVFAPSGIDPHP